MSDKPKKMTEEELERSRKVVRRALTRGGGMTPYNSTPASVTRRLLARDKAKRAAAKEAQGDA